MTTGTKSLLFGVHQVFWHPWTVWRAWQKLYGKRPTFWEAVAILVHDWGYRGCARMDDERGQEHPMWGAGLIYCLHTLTHRRTLGTRMVACDWARFVAFHSSHLARKHGAEPSKLCAPDKLSIMFDPEWWYLLRARLSGEIWEYIANSPFPERTPREWYRWYRTKVITRYLSCTK